MDRINVKAVKIRPGAKLPVYVYDGDAGADLYSAEDCRIEPGERKLVRTGISLAIPYGYEGQVRPKSGIALKRGVTVLNSPGTIDSTYRGEICVLLINTDLREAYDIKTGEKIAQIVFKAVARAEFLPAESLENSARNEGSFGSTGV